MGWRVGFACTVAAVLHLSCGDEQLNNDQIEWTEDQIVLGDKLENPFTLANMQRAIENLKKSDADADANLPDKIEPTHHYVRFLPRTEEELDRLLQDSALQLSDYPLDYAIQREGLFYHDPQLTDTEYTYLYAAIPVNKDLDQNIYHEILDDLYLPSSNDFNRQSRSMTDFAAAIEDQAFKQLGLNEESDDVSVSGRSTGKWTPSGRVTVWDDRLNKLIALPGAKVQARRWFYFQQAITDDNGYFFMDKPLRGEVRYRLVFERKHFDIRSGTFGQAKVEGPKKRGDWNLEIQDHTMAFHYAHAFRAAIRFYYGNNGGLTRPNFRLKYSVFDKRGNHAARNIGNWSLFGINPNILLYRYASSDGRQYHADEIFSNTCHETAHTTHMQIMNAGMVQFMQVSEPIRESWAVGVEWFLTQLEYKEKGIANYGDPGFVAQVNYPALHGFQYWSKRRSETLTSLFIDLVDRNNQRGQTYGYSQVGTVNDVVAGYTLAEIENGILVNTYGLGSLSAELKKRKPPEVREQDIDLLLQYF